MDITGYHQSGGKMASCHSYGGVTRDNINQLRADIAKEGVSFPAGDTGIIDFKGVQISVDYQEATNTLKLCIEKRPFYVTEAHVWEILDASVGPHAT
jgi:hypothetical protein